MMLSWLIMASPPQIAVVSSAERGFALQDCDDPSLSVRHFIRVVT